MTLKAQKIVQLTGGKIYVMSLETFQAVSIIYNMYSEGALVITIWTPKSLKLTIYVMSEKFQAVNIIYSQVPCHHLETTEHIDLLFSLETFQTVSIIYSYVPYHDYEIKKTFRV